MIELSVIRDLVAIFGVIAGFSYYVLTVRNADKVRKMQLISRIREQGGRSVTNELYGEELMEMEWEDFDDFRAKYDSTVNPENWAKRSLWFGYYQEIGYMLHESIVDVEMVYNVLGGHNALQMWAKFESIILGQRKLYRDPSWYKYFEYFATEIKKYRVSQGIEAEITDADGYINR
jgi:hypothetical protein